MPAGESVGGGPGYQRRVDQIISRIVTPLPDIERQHAQRRGVRRLGAYTKATATEIASAFAPSTRNGWLANGAVVIAGGAARLLEVTTGVPRTLTIPLIEGARFLGGSVQLDSELKGIDNSSRPSVTQRESRAFAKEQQDLSFSGEFRLALHLWFKEKQDPSVIEKRVGLERLFPDNPKMLAFARAKLKEIYETSNKELRRQHRQREGEDPNVFLGNPEHPIISTRALQITGKIDRQVYEFFEGKGKERRFQKKKRRFGEGYPVHEKILEALQKEKNRALRLTVLQGSETAVSNFLTNQLDRNHKRIVANRVSQVFSGLQIAFAATAASIFYAGAHEAFPISVAAGVALAGALAIPDLAIVVPTLVMSLLVLGAGFSIAATIAKIRSKNAIIRGAKEDRKLIPQKAEEILRRIDGAMEPISSKSA